MIYTVTLNPAIDYVARLDTMRLGATNRNTAEELQFGGKGINVARVLQTLEVPCAALGFVAGFTGDALERGLREQGLDTRFLRASSGLTRINVKIKAQEETELNGIGPHITESDLTALEQQLSALSTGDYLVLSGSLASGLGPDTYARLMRPLTTKGVRIVVDTDGEPLRHALRQHPWLVKPNQEELGRFFHTKLRTMEQVQEAAVALQSLGAQNVLVSCGGAGALLVDEQGVVHTCKAPTGTVVNSVGAGDSMVAGFLASWSREADYAAALRLGIAAGSATAFSLGLADREAIEALLKK